MTGTSGGDLEAKYRRLSKAFEASEKEAAAVNTGIGDVEAVASKLFAELEDELGQYQSESLRSASRAQLDQTRSQYDRLLVAMKTAASKMDPVLSALRDQVLFLKHNLNAQAIASLGTTVGQIENDVARLIRELEASIGEADAFIRQMGEVGAAKW